MNTTSDFVEWDVSDFVEWDVDLFESVYGESPCSSNCNICINRMKACYEKGYPYPDSKQKEKARPTPKKKEQEMSKPLFTKTTEYRVDFTVASGEEVNDPYEGSYRPSHGYSGVVSATNLQEALQKVLDELKKLGWELLGTPTVRTNVDFRL